VLFAAAERLQDYDEKVRLAAVKAVCQAARQLLVGPASTAAAGTGSANAGALLSPVDALLGSNDSQELTDAAAADLDLATAAALGSPGAAAAAATVRDVPFVHEALRRVLLRLRDTKPSVRKATASHFLGIFRAVVAAGVCTLLLTACRFRFIVCPLVFSLAHSMRSGHMQHGKGLTRTCDNNASCGAVVIHFHPPGDAAQITKCCWLVARVLLCCKSDKELRVQLFEATAKDGLLGPKIPPAQAAAAWVRLWLTSSEMEREALLLLLKTRTALQVGGC
jgi:hypothetical protein